MLGAEGASIVQHETQKPVRNALPIAGRAADDVDLDDVAIRANS
jgi:hypothetical protein